MSTDTKWIIGTIVPAILVVAGLLSAQIAGVNDRIDDLRADLTARMDRLDERLRNLEVAIGQIDQRLLTTIGLPRAEAAHVLVLGLCTGARSRRDPGDPWPRS